MADYGMILMVQFARSRDQRKTAAELAEQTALPLPTVSKLTKQLAAAGLLESHRGASGGFVLSKNPADISVAKIIAALEGPIALTDCMAADGTTCEIEAMCPTRTNWRQINEALVGALEDVSLAEMARPPFSAPRPQPVIAAAAGSTAI